MGGSWEEEGGWGNNTLAGMEVAQQHVLCLPWAASTELSINGALAMAWHGSSLQASGQTGPAGMASWQHVCQEGGRVEEAVEGAAFQLSMEGMWACMYSMACSITLLEGRPAASALFRHIMYMNISIWGRGRATFR